MSEGGAVTAVTVVSGGGEGGGGDNRVVVTSVYGILFLLGINYWVISVCVPRDIVLY